MKNFFKTIWAWIKNEEPKTDESASTKNVNYISTSTLESHAKFVEEKLTKLKQVEHPVVYHINDLFKAVNPEFNEGVFAIVIGMLASRAVIAYYGECREKSTRKFIGRFRDISNLPKEIGERNSEEICFEIFIILI
jgi:hypothetical protein